MTPSMLAWYLRATRRIASLRPEVAASLLRSLQTIRDSLTDAELARLIASGDLERLFADQLSDESLNRAFIPFRARLRQVVERGFDLTVSDLPKGGTIDGVLAVSFDHLNPTVVTAIRGLETDAITALTGDIKETVRAFVENGLRDGRSAASVARELRSVIGLAPSQEAWVRNLRTELESGQYADAASRKLLDQRFNLSSLDQLSAADKAARIDTIVTQYRKRAIALNASTNARTATLESYKAGQRLSWDAARSSGVVPDGYVLTKTWVGVMDDRERPEHVAMEGETVPVDSPYSNGNIDPGDDTYNCRCLSRIRAVAA